MKEPCNHCSGTGRDSHDRYPGRCWACTGTGYRLLIYMPPPTPEQIAAKQAEEAEELARWAERRQEELAAQDRWEELRRYL